MFPAQNTIRRLMLYIAAAAALGAVMLRLRPTGSHTYYHAQRAASCRKLERQARQQASSTPSATERAHWGRIADEASQEAEVTLKASRRDGYNPSDLPDGIRRYLKSEDLNP